MSETQNQMDRRGAETPSFTLGISIRQPWAWLIVNGYKDIENRTWATKVRGRVLVHAAKGMSRAEYEDCRRMCEAFPLGFIPLPDFEQLQRGGIVGSVEIVDCVTAHPSYWFGGPVGFVLQCAIVAEEFRPYKGELGFFRIFPSGKEKE